MLILKPMAENLRALEDRHTIGITAKLPLALERGEGFWVWDDQGNKYLDLYGGHAVALAGHSPPEVVAAIAEQAKKLLFYSNAVYSAARARAAQRLTSLAPDNLKKVFFVNSGAEANENALKVARKWRGRRRIVSFRGSFHGRTAGAMSVTGLAPYDRQHKEIVPGTVFCRWGDVAEVDAALDGDTAGVLLEPIQSLGGVRVADVDFVRRLEELCRSRGAALIFDEVQTAVGRAGTPFIAQHYGVKPHLISTAKGIASGVPCAALLVDEGLAETVGGNDYGTTFGGGPLAMAACDATLALVQEKRLWENAARVGAYAKELLAKVKGVSEVRGLGLLLGVQVDRPAKKVRDALMQEHRILVGTSSEEQTLRLLPPLTISEKEIDFLAVALEKVLQRSP
jgi:acetylornithine aminotransferase/acetylornithine/N-succinyldiaminopimelate aminotransferase